MLRYRVVVVAFIYNDGEWEEVEQDTLIEFDNLPKYFETLAANQSSGLYQVRKVTVTEHDIPA